MSDLISRQDAIDALGDEPEVWNDTDAEWAERDAWVMHKVAIESLPSADAVEVVRCMNCVYGEERIEDYRCGKLDEDWDIRFRHTHYCSYGKRREP